jgi:hypothetical protein
MAVDEGWIEVGLWLAFANAGAVISRFLV